MKEIKETKEENIKEEIFVPEDNDNETLVLRGPIITYGADYTLDSIRQYVEGNQIIVQPSFQRKFVWDIKKASKLIESFILGYPVPNILLGRNTETETMEVIDGQQRILSICYFFKGSFRDEKIFRLVGDIEERFKNKTFEDLDEQIQKKLKNAVLKAAILVYSKDDPNIKFTAFQRINSGSVILNQQEIRNCIYGGSLNNLLIDLNEKSENWRKLLSKKIDNRMRDDEVILRFFAAYYNGYFYEKPITEFLNKFMEKNKNLDLEECEKWKSLFDSTLKIIIDNIGQELFPKFAGKKSFNRAIFESVMAAVARINKENKLDSKSLKNKYELLLKNKDYLDAVTSQTSDKKKYTDRMKLAHKYLS